MLERENEERPQMSVVSDWGKVNANVARGNANVAGSHVTKLNYNHLYVIYVFIPYTTLSAGYIGVTADAFCIRSSQN